MQKKPNFENCFPRASKQPKPITAQPHTENCGNGYTGNLNSCRTLIKINNIVQTVSP